MSGKLVAESRLPAEFSRQLRLLTAKNYQAVFNGNPTKVTCPAFTLLAVDNSQSHSRLGLIVAKKNVRFAVDRNRLKRLTRESFRLNQTVLPHVDIVILARRGSSELSNEVLFQHLKQLWRRLAKKHPSQAKDG